MGFLFVAYSAAIDRNQQRMTWEPAEAGGLRVKAASRPRTNESLG